MNQAFYAIGKTKVPLLAGSICLITNPLLCLYFVVGGYGPITLTLTYSISSLIQMIVLCVLYSRNKELRPNNMLGFIVKTFASASLGGVAVYLIYSKINSQVLLMSKIKQLGILCGYGVTFLAIYFLCTLVFGIDESKYWTDKIKSKLLRK